MGEPYLWRTANMSRRTCVVVKQMQSNTLEKQCTANHVIMSIYTPGSIPKEEKKQSVTQTFRICINIPSGSSSRECCNLTQDCFKGPRALASAAEHQAPQVGTITV